MRKRGSAFTDVRMPARPLRRPEVSTNELKRRWGTKTQASLFLPKQTTLPTENSCGRSSGAATPRLCAFGCHGDRGRARGAHRLGKYGSAVASAHPDATVLSRRGNPWWPRRGSQCPLYPAASGRSSWLRRDGSKLPIIFVTARADIASVLGHESHATARPGAD